MTNEALLLLYMVHIQNY